MNETEDEEKIEDIPLWKVVLTPFSWFVGLAIGLIVVWVFAPLIRHLIP